MIVPYLKRVRGGGPEPGGQAAPGVIRLRRRSRYEPAGLDIPGPGPGLGPGPEIEDVRIEPAAPAAPALRSSGSLVSRVTGKSQVDPAGEQRQDEIPAPSAQPPPATVAVTPKPSTPEQPVPAPERPAHSGGPASPLAQPRASLRPGDRRESSTPGATRRARPSGSERSAQRIAMQAPIPDPPDTPPLEPQPAHISAARRVAGASPPLQPPQAPPTRAPSTTHPKPGSDAGAQSTPATATPRADAIAPVIARAAALAAAAPRAANPRGVTEQQAKHETSVTVTIGRLEVRSQPAVPERPAQPRTPRRRPTSLDQYLRSRSAGRGG